MIFTGVLLLSRCQGEVLEVSWGSCSLLRGSKGDSGSSWESLSVVLGVYWVVLVPSVGILVLQGVSVGLVESSGTY